MFYLTTQSASIHICWHLAFQRHSERCGQKTICSPACQCGSLAEIHDASKSITNYIYLRIIKKKKYFGCLSYFLFSFQSWEQKRCLFSTQPKWILVSGQTAFNLSSSWKTAHGNITFVLRSCILYLLTNCNLHCAKNDFQLHFCLYFIQAALLILSLCSLSPPLFFCPPVMSARAGGVLLPTALIIMSTSAIFQK